MWWRHGPHQDARPARRYAFDAFGRRITYVVDKRATLKSSCLVLQNYPTNNGTGGIAVKDATAGSTISGVMAAYISHGADGHGAFPHRETRWGIASIWA